MFATRNKAKMGAVVSTAVLCFALLVPTAASAAEGDEASVTSDTTVVTEADPPEGEEATEASTPAEEPAEEAPAEEVVTEKEPPVVVEPDQEETKAPAEESSEKDSKDEQKAKDDTKSTKTYGDHEKACTDDKDVKVDDRNERLTEVTVTLKPDFTTCDVSLEGFDTDGPTWPTSGTQEDVDFDTATLTKKHPTVTLKITNDSCFQQNDLFIGKTRFDGIDGPVPHYPDVSTPTNIILSWNGGEACTFSCPTVTDGPVATQNDEAGWTHDDTRTTDTEPRHEYIDGAIRLFTKAASSAEKSTLYRDVSGPMATFGEPSVEFGNGSGGKPGLQYGIDADGNGSIDGMLVGEPWIESYGGHWSLFNSTFGSAAQFVKDGAPHNSGGYGSQWHGTWDEWIAAFPNAQSKKLGLSLGSGVLGDWEVTSITGGCAKYTFDFEKPPVVIGSNPAYTVDQACGWIEITATNEVTLKEGEIGTDAFFNLTVGNGETQLITVKPNEKFVKTLSFEENSGVQIVKFGVKGEDQETFTVETDCVQTPYTPLGAEFHDACGTLEDGTIVPGIKQRGTSGQLPNGDTFYSYESVTDDGTYYVTETTVDGVKSSRVVFVSSDPDAVITQPGEGDSYTVVDNTAVWTYTFDNEPCPPNNPPTPPKPPVTPIDHPNGGIDTGASGAYQGAASDVSVAGVTSSSNDNISSGVLWALVVLMLGGAVAVRPIRKAVATRK